MSSFGGAQEQIWNENVAGSTNEAWKFSRSKRTNGWWCIRSRMHERRGREGRMSRQQEEKRHETLEGRWENIDLLTAGETERPQNIAPAIPVLKIEARSLSPSHLAT